VNDRPPAPVVVTQHHAETGRHRFGLPSALLFLVAVGLILIGVVYFTESSAHLPTFLPGHYEAWHGPGHVAQAHKHHIGLGLLSFGLGVLAIMSALYVAESELDE